nr:hypothetical protein CFP56_31932 [Quercus suber]
MDVDAPPGIDAPGDPLSPSSANPPEPVAPIGLGASLPPLPPKQGVPGLSKAAIACKHGVSLELVYDPFVEEEVDANMEQEGGEVRVL